MFFFINKRHRFYKKTIRFSKIFNNKIQNGVAYMKHNLKVLFIFYILIENVSY